MGLFDRVRRMRGDRADRALVERLSAKGLVPQRLGHCLGSPQGRRIFLISNGPLDCADRIARDAAADDVMIQFNSCRHSEALEGAKAHHVYLLHMRPVGGKVIGGEALAARLGSDLPADDDPVAVACYGGRFLTRDAVERANHRGFALLDYDALLKAAAADIP
ncbi:hypothetical protein [Paracoccus salsus]|uniref:hypothetical protein n=1 Tax=Paracoccus salsus TaxID=2911061 RepID=UPI001F437BE2|nr:hypothetical protein [Paracoccus salsus]MCF3972633.1 hypothetical protein [Paracoccus salsus]